MNAKEILKQVIPPILLKMYRKIGDPHLSGFLWTGKYLRYSDVKAQGEGYRGRVWITSRSSQTQIVRKEIENGNGIPIVRGFRFGSLALLASLVSPRSQKLRILDFGGGMGVAYPQVLHSLGEEFPLEYHIVENSESCIEGRKIFIGDSRIQFHEGLDNSLTNIDIVFMSGVLQYVDDYSAIIHSLIKLHPSFVLMTFLPVGSMSTFASAQVNLKGSVLPTWFFNLNELISIFTSLKYQLLCKLSIEPEDCIDMGNFEEEDQLNHMSTLFFANMESDDNVRQ